MWGTHDLWLFVFSGWLLNVTPGPDTLFIVGRSSALGVRAGVVAALGIGAGLFVHVGAAALGLSALLATSETAFAAIKLVGAAYLLYVGFGLVRSSETAIDPKQAQAGRPTQMRGIFLQGFLTNVLNPKVALFFLAFLPQFVSADAMSKPMAFLFLGILFDFNGTVWNLLVAWSTARLSRRLAPGVKFKKWFNRCVGGLFAAVGLRLAFDR